MDNQNSKHMNYNKISEHTIKNTGQDYVCLPALDKTSTLYLKKVNQTAHNHNNFMKRNNNHPVEASIGRQHISSARFPTTNDQKHCNQNVAVHPSHTDKKNDCPVGTSSKREHIPLDINKMLSKISDKESFYCYTCESTVTEKDIFQHLFFGPLQCANCSVRIGSCNKFTKMYHSQDKCRTIAGPHIYTDWIKSSIPFIKYCIRKDLTVKRHIKNMTELISTYEVKYATAHYFKKIQVLKAHNPWKLAFEKCKFSKKIERSLTENDIQQAESGIKHTASNNKFRKQDSKHLDQQSKSACNSLTHKQENKLVNPDDTPSGVNNNTKVSLSTKCVKPSHCNKTRGHISKVNSTPRNSNWIQHADQDSESVSKSFTHGKENGLKVSVNENPLTASSNLRKTKKPKGQVKNKQWNGSDIPQQAKAAGDQCLVVHSSKNKCPKKCPKCHCTLSISTLTFDCSTFVMKIVCLNCAFPVYIMPDRKTKLTFQKRLLGSNV